MGHTVVTDIDIDVADRNAVLALFPHIVASRKDSNGKVKQHNTGVYFHDIPVDPFTGLSSLDYKEAEEKGYFKIDILNVNFYKQIKDRKHMEDLLEREPMWELLEEKDFCDLLFQMRGHHKICKIMKPRSISQLAAVLAMIRPAKKHLIGKPWPEVMAEVWKKPEDGQYYYKRSHSFSYAMAVKLHMNLITEQIINGTFGTDPNEE